MAQTPNIYDRIFGESPATQQAAAERSTAYKDWINARKQAMQEQRTEDIKMARYHALGNVLTTMVQPLGWAAGGATTAVQQPDKRQYLESFNRAIKDSENLRNIGAMEQEYQFKLADENYRRQLALDDEARKRSIAYEDFKAKQDYQLQQQEKLMAQRHQNTMAEIASRGDYNLTLAEVKGKYKITSGSNRTPISEKLLSSGWTAYQKYRATWQQRNDAGLQQPPLQTFAEYMAASGYNVSLYNGGSQGGASGSGSSGNSGSKPSGGGSSSSKTPPSKAKKNGSSGSGAGSKTPPSKRK